MRGEIEVKAASIEEAIIKVGEVGCEMLQYTGNDIEIEDICEIM